MSEQLIVIETVETSDQARELAKELPALLRETVDAYTEQKRHTVTGGHFYTSQKAVYESTVRARDLAALFLANVPGKTREAFRKKIGVSVPDECFREDNYFSGMANPDYAKELTGETTKLQQAFQRAREELAASGLKESLQASATGMQRKRKRKLSDIEGQYDYLRRYDAFPFVTHVIENREAPNTVELCFPMTMNGGASQKELNEFCARCLALAEIIEGAGYRVRIVGESWNTVGSNQGTRTELTHIVLREEDEYGDVQSLATYASAEFFRRIMFLFLRSPSHAIHGLSSEHKNTGVGCTVESRPLPAMPGQVILDQATVSQLFVASPEKQAEMFQARIDHTKKQERAEALVMGE